MALNWEVVDTEKVSRGHTCTTSRVKVPGGWLVKGITRSGYGGGIGMTFVPDPEYAWKL